MLKRLQFLIYLEFEEYFNMLHFIVSDQTINFQETWFGQSRSLDIALDKNVVMIWKDSIEIKTVSKRS